MKRIAILIIFLSLAAQVHATVPLLINYSGKLTDNSGNLIPDGNYAMEFNLYDAPSGGNLVWWEVYNVSPGITVRGGSFNVILGGLRSLNNVPFDKPYYLEFGFANLTTLNYTVFPRQQLLSTPYSMRAGISDQVADNCITSSKIADGTISTCDIADNTITAAKILSGTITSSKITTTAGQRILTTNIEDNAITNAKIAGGAVDQTKAPFAPQVAVNGAWQNSPKIACGKNATDANGNVHVDLTAYGFTQTPIVVCTAIHDSIQFAVTIYPTDLSSNGFGVCSRMSNNNGAAVWFEWVAIGY